MANRNTTKAPQPPKKGQSKASATPSNSNSKNKPKPTETSASSKSKDLAKSVGPRGSKPSGADADSKTKRKIKLSEKALAQQANEDAAAAKSAVVKEKREKAKANARAREKAAEEATPELVASKDNEIAELKAQLAQNRARLRNSKDANKQLKQSNTELKEQLANAPPPPVDNQTDGVLDESIPKPTYIGRKRGNQESVSLAAAMGLDSPEDKPLYDLIQATTRSAITSAQIPLDATYREVSSKVKMQVKDAVVEKHGFLRRFKDYWPVEEMIKLNIQRKRNYNANKHDRDSYTYKTRVEKTRIGQEQHDMGIGGTNEMRNIIKVQKKGKRTASAAGLDRLADAAAKKRMRLKKEAEEQRDRDSTAGPQDETATHDVEMEDGDVGNQVGEEEDRGEGAVGAGERDAEDDRGGSGEEDEDESDKSDSDAARDASEDGYAVSGVQAEDDSDEESSDDDEESSDEEEEIEVNTTD